MNQKYPQPIYGSQPTNLVQPQVVYGQPPVSYGQSQVSYGQPQVSYGQPQASYGQPQVSYGQPQSQAAYFQPSYVQQPGVMVASPAYQQFPMNAQPVIMDQSGMIDPQMLDETQNPNHLGINVMADFPVAFWCTFCNQESMTIMNTQSGTGTITISIILCCIGCWLCCWIPFCCDDCKDKIHNCSNCGRVVGHKAIF